MHLALTRVYGLIWQTLTEKRQLCTITSDDQII